MCKLEICIYITFFTQLIGITECKAGFFGDSCDEPCPSGSFGLKCGGKCLPRCAIEECNHITGCLKDKMTGKKQVQNITSQARDVYVLKNTMAYYFMG